MSVWESSVAWTANALQSVCSNRSWSSVSAPSGHTLTVLTVGFTHLWWVVCIWGVETRRGGQTVLGEKGGWLCILFLTPAGEHGINEGDCFLMHQTVSNVSLLSHDLAPAAAPTHWSSPGTNPIKIKVEFTSYQPLLLRVTSTTPAWRLHPALPHSKDATFCW